MRGAAEQIEYTLAEGLALKVPKGDVNRGGCVRRDAAMVAVPPRLLLILPPQRLGMDGIFADQTGRHALDNRLGGEVCLRKLSDRIAPADLAVIGGDLDEAEMPKRIEIVGLRIAHRNGFDLGDFHGRTNLTDIATEK